jgi:hypothetical protein
MSWPLGYLARFPRCRVDAGRGLLAGDWPATDPDGWIALPAPSSVPATGSAPALAVRLRVAPDACGAPFLYAEDVCVGPRRYRSIHALAFAEGAGWIAYLTRAIAAELARRAQGTGTCGPKCPPTLDAQSVVGSTSADETSRASALRSDAQDRWSWRATRLDSP